ncbi:LysR family transcriptional regulator [Vibrio sp. S4M6]|uniref:LysR family transcriptional regulator n=1 Tax=Vibrio sinus TaxID=2946865 RepID=UPI002029B8EA|nr:LysR family transcriptional regulator [Vibrio sinus]MCL9780779.1 LysR family transcriptional regulator [Vibrio sinus]
MSTSFPSTDLLNGIVIFSIVAKCGSFSQAAKISGHSISYVSKEVSKLEERLRVKLIHRTTRTLRLTSEGDAYFQYCQKVIEEIEYAESQVSGYKEEPVGTLRVSCPYSLGLAKIHQVFQEFLQLYPSMHLELDLNEKKTDLISSDMDVAIRASNQMHDDDEVASKLLIQSHSITIASPDYLNKYGTPTSPVDLVNHNVISYSNMTSPNIWRFGDESDNDIQIQVKNVITTNSPEMELKFCKSGYGITRIPCYLLRDELQEGQLVELFSDYPKHPVNIYLVYPNKKTHPCKLRVFIDFLMEKLAAAPTCSMGSVSRSE